MTENEMAAALKLARDIFEKLGNDHDGCDDQCELRSRALVARALISCREPVEIQLGSVDHACVCGQRYLSIAYMNFCPGCGRPLVWK